MSASTASLNVLRWSALGLGLAYGVYHQRNLTSAAKTAEAKRAWKDQENLIARAKQEFAKKQGGATGALEENLGLGDKGFDLDKWFASV